MFPMIVGLVMVTSIPMPTAGHGNFVHVSVGITPERTYDFHANITPGSTAVIALKIQSKFVARIRTVSQRGPQLIGT